MTYRTSSIAANPPLSFYVIGGTLRNDAPSYVERYADRDLFEGLIQGEFCYVLTPRQMGKSSLMVRTAARLREQGVKVAILDLTALGQNTSPEQWYGGLLSQLGQRLDLEDELIEFWQEPSQLGPLQRWAEAIRQVVLKNCPGNVVIFIDEIDAVRSLPFSTDEFFAAIRELYNRRIEAPELSRLAFCLLGVATPSDLITNTRTTPFNIGRRVELHDFTETEAVPLARGLGREKRHGAALLKRMLYWTGGHPYLTQQFCRAVAEDPSVSKDADVDRLCEVLFISQRARGTNDNLLFVRDRMLRSEVDLAGLLQSYEAVYRGRRVRDDNTNPMVSIMLLSGIVRSADGYLRVRNRIYRRVFDHKWVEASTPDAELRRQRAAFRRGFWRATAAASIIVVIVSALAITTIRAYRQADTQRIIAQAQERSKRQLLYTAQMNLAQQAWESATVGSVMDLLEAQRPAPGQEDLRGFEWHYLWRLCHSDLVTLHASNSVTSIALSPDGKTLAAGTEDSAVTLWDVATGRELSPALTGHTDAVNSVAFSPDGKTLATASADQTINLWEMTSRRKLTSIIGHRNVVHSVAFSPDGRHLASASADGTAKLWDVTSGKELLTLRDHAGEVHAVVFSPDGKTVATGNEFYLKLWDVETGRELASFKGHTGGVNSVAFSPDGRTLAQSSNDLVVLWDVGTRQSLNSFKGHTGLINAVAYSPDSETLVTAGQDGLVKLWDVSNGQERWAFKGHTDTVRCAMFSVDGKTLATGSKDMTVKLWDATRRPEEFLALKGHTEHVASVAFSPDGRIMATGSNDLTARLWDLVSGQQLSILSGHRDTVRCVAFSPDGKTLATGGDNMIRLWDVATRKEMATLKGNNYWVHSIAFSPDGKMLATGSHDRSVKLWDVAGGQELAALPRHTGPVYSVAFSADGKTLAYGHKMEVRLWDIAGGHELAVSEGHESLINSVAKYPDVSMYGDISTGVHDWQPDWYMVGGPEGPGLPVVGRTRVHRSQGWHKLEIRIEGTGYQTLIDDTPVAYGEGDFGFTDVYLWIQAPLWRPQAYYYFDDFSITSHTDGQSYNDGFEGQTIAPFWNVIDQQFGTVALSSDKSHSGTQSVKLSTLRGGQREIRLGRQFSNLMKGNVSVWLYDAFPGAETLSVRMTLHDRTITPSLSTSLSPDGRILAIGNNDKTVKLLDVGSGQELATLLGHGGPVWCVAFSPDGNRLATGSEDRTIKLWDVSTRQEVATLKGLTDTVLHLEFSADGKILAAVSADRIVRVWRTETSK